MFMLLYCVDVDANVQEFVFYLYKIEMLGAEADCPCVMVCDDFNAHVTTQGVTSHVQ